MQRLTFSDLISEVAAEVTEIFPWELVEELVTSQDLLLLDVRCLRGFERTHIDGSINVPRGILETSCDYGYEETVPQLVEARNRRVIVICRSGNRSILAALTMQRLGYREVVSLKTDLRGSNDYEQPSVNGEGKRVSIEVADKIYLPVLTPEQQGIICVLEVVLRNNAV